MNALFDKVVTGLHVHSEHCIGALKGRFQCLCGLQVHVNSNNNHYKACKWISVAIILHNIVVNVERNQSEEHFRNFHGPGKEEEDTGIQQEDGGVDINDNNAKCRQLVEELWVLQHE